METATLYPASLYPTLAALVEAGTVWVEEGDVVGEAADGTVVGLGNADNPGRLERYLRAHPTPETW